MDNFNQSPIFNRGSPTVSRITQGKTMYSPTTSNTLSTLKSAVDDFIEFRKIERDVIFNNSETQTDIDFDGRSFEDASALLSDARKTISVLAKEKSELDAELKSVNETLSQVRKDMGLRMFRLQQELDRKNLEIDNLKKDKEDFEYREQMLRWQCDQRVKELTDSLDKSRALSIGSEKIRGSHAITNIKESPEMELMAEELEITQDMLLIQTQRADELAHIIVELENDLKDISASMTSLNMFSPKFEYDKDDCSTPSDAFDLHFDFPNFPKIDDLLCEFRIDAAADNFFHDVSDNVKESLVSMSNWFKQELNVIRQAEEEYIELFLRTNDPTDYQEIISFIRKNQAPTVTYFDAKCDLLRDIKTSCASYFDLNESMNHLQVKTEMSSLMNNTTVPDNTITDQVELEIENAFTVKREDTAVIEQFAKEFADYLIENEIFHPDDPPPTDVQVFNYVLEKYLRLMEAFHNTRETLFALEKQGAETSMKAAALISQLDNSIDNLTTSSLDFDSELRSSTICEPVNEISFSSTIVNEVTHDPLELTIQVPVVSSPSANRSMVTPMKRILRTEPVSSVKKNVTFQSPIVARGKHLETENARLKTLLEKCSQQCVTLEQTIHSKTEEVSKLTGRIETLDASVKDLIKGLEVAEVEFSREKEELRNELAREVANAQEIRTKLLGEAVNLDPSLADDLSNATDVKILSVLLDTIITRCKLVQDQEKLSYDKDRGQLLHEVSHLAAKNQSLQETIRSLQFDMSATKSLYETATSVIDVSRTAETETNKALEARELEYKIKIADLEATINSLKEGLSVVENLQQRCHEHETERKNLEFRIAELDDDLKKLSSENERLICNAEQLSQQHIAEVTELQSEIGTLKTRLYNLSTLDCLFEESRKEKSRVETELREMTEKMTTLICERDALAEEIRLMTKRSETECRELKTLVATLQDEKMSLAQDLEDSKVEKNNIQIELKRAMEMYEAAGDEKKIVLVELEKLNDKYNLEASELQKLQYALQEGLVLKEKLIEEIEAFKNAEIELNATIDKLSSDKSDLIRQMQIESESQHTEISTLQNAIASLEKRLSEMDQEKVTLETKINEISDAIIVEVDKNSAAIKSLESQVENLSTEKDEAVEEYLDAMAIAEEIVNANNEIKKDILAIKHELENENETVFVLNNKCASLLAEVATLSNTVSSERLQKNVILNQFDVVRVAFSEAQKKITELENLLGEKRHVASELLSERNTILSDAEQQIMQLTEDLQNARRDISNKSEELMRLESTVSDYTDDVSKANSKILDSENKIKNMENEISVVSQELKTAHSIASELQEELAKKTSQLEETEDGIKEALKSLSIVEALVVINQSEIHDSNEKLTERDIAMSKLQKDIDNLNSALEKCQEELNSKCNALSQRNVEVVEKEEELTKLKLSLNAFDEQLKCQTDKLEEAERLQKTNEESSLEQIRTIELLQETLQKKNDMLSEIVTEKEVKSEHLKLLEEKLSSIVKFMKEVGETSKDLDLNNMTLEIPSNCCDDVKAIMEFVNCLFDSIRSLRHALLTEAMSSRDENAALSSKLASETEMKNILNVKVAELVEIQSKNEVRVKMELESLQKEKRKLKSELVNAESQQRSSQDLVSDLEARLSEVHGALKCTNEKLESVMKERAEFQVELTTKDEKIKELYADLSKREDELLNKIAATSTELTNEMKALEEQICRTKEDNYAKEIEIETLKQDKIVLESLMANVKAKYAESERSLSYEKDRNEVIEDKYQSVCNEITILKAEVVQLIDRKSELNKQITALTESKANAENRITELSGAVEEYKRIAKLNQLQTEEINSLKDKLTQLIENQRSKEVEVAKLNEENSALKECLDEAKFKCLAGEEAISFHKEDKMRIEEELKSAREEVATVRADFDHNLQVKTNLMEQNAMLSESVTAAEIQIAKLSDAVERYKSTEKAILLKLDEKHRSDEAARSMADEILTLKAEISVLKNKSGSQNELEMRVSSLTSRVCELESELQEKCKLLKCTESRMRQLATEKNEIWNKLTAKELEVLRLKKENDKTNRSQEEVTLKITSFESEILNLKRSVEVLMKENANLKSEIDILTKKNQVLKDENAKFETMGESLTQQVADLRRYSGPRTRSSDHISNKRMNRLEELNEALNDLLIAILTEIKFPNIDDLVLITISGIKKATRDTVKHAKKIMESENALKGLKDQLKDLDQENQELSDNMEVLLKENSELELKVINQEKHAAGAGACKKCSELDKAIAARDNEIVELKSVCNLNNRNLTKLMSESKEFQDKCSTLEKTCERLTERLGERDEQLMRATSVTRTCLCGGFGNPPSKTTVDYEEKVRTLTKSNDKLKELLRDSTQRNKALEAKVASASMNTNQINSPIRERSYNLRTRSDVSAPYKKALRKSEGIENFPSMR